MSCGLTEIQLDMVYFLFRKGKLKNCRTYHTEALLNIFKTKYPHANLEKELQGLKNDRWVGPANKQGREALYTTPKIKSYLIEHGYQVERVISLD